MTRARLLRYLARLQHHAALTTSVQQGAARGLRAATSAHACTSEPQWDRRWQHSLAAQLQESAAEASSDEGQQGVSQQEEVQVGEARMRLETGHLAPLADGAATASSGDTTVLATVVCEPPPQPLWRQRLWDNFLEVDFQERFSAAGAIPRNSQRREMGASARDMAIAHLTEAALQPLFAPGFASRCQVQGSLISSDGGADVEALTINAASAALATSDVPWAGPLGAVRVARVPEQQGRSRLVVGPSAGELEVAELTLLYAGTPERCTFLELQGRNVPLEAVTGALRRAHEASSEVGAALQRLAQAAGQPKRDIPSIRADPAALHNVARLGRPAVDAVLGDREMTHAARLVALQQARADLEARLRATGMFRLEHMRLAGSGCVSPRDLDEAWPQLQAASLRDLALHDNARPDGRGSADVRLLQNVDASLPGVHGSAVVNAGSTQVLAVATVGNEMDSAMVDTLHGQEQKTFIAHYTCPSYAINEMKRRTGAAKRIETAGSRLLEAALAPVMPDQSRFPFALRLTADVLAADGSAAMAAVSAASLALHRAAVPMSSLVAGVSVGLLAEDSGGSEGVASSGGRWEVLADAGGLEEDLGAMQLNVAGTRKGLTAVQVTSIAPGGVPLKVLEAGLAMAARALASNLAALETLVAQDALQQRRQPCIGSVDVGKDNMKRVIGSGGSTIKMLEASTRTKLVVAEGGIVHIYAPSAEKYNAVKAQIQGMTGASIEEGLVYKVRVVRLMDYGAFVQLPNGFQALLHISELAHHKVRAVEEELTEGQELEVLCNGRDARGFVKVSRKALLPPLSPEQAPASLPQRPVADEQPQQQPGLPGQPPRRAQATGRRDWLGGIGGRSQHRQLSSFDSRRMGISLTQQGQKVD